MFLGCTLGSVSISESSALVVGRLLGRNNFSYFISPKKTIEGFIGQYLGIIGSYFVIQACMWIANADSLGFGAKEMFTIGFFMITVAILGDLMESIIKRAVNVKDSSSIKIVGRLGGILDKFDSFGVAWIAMGVAVRVYRPELLPY